MNTTPHPNGNGHHHGVRFKFEPVLTLNGIVTTGSFLIAALAFYFQTSQGLKEGEDARKKYIPIVESLVNSDQLQNERFGNVSDAILQIRKTQADENTLRSQQQAETNKALTRIQIDIAAIKERLPPKRASREEVIPQFGQQ